MFNCCKFLNLTSTNRLRFMYYLTPAEGKLNPRKSVLKSLLKLGYLGLEPRTYRLKAECSTIELVTLKPMP